MKIFAIDPGTTQSGWLYMEEGRIVALGIEENHRIIEHIQAQAKDVRIVIEMVAHYGMPAGASLFETCVWIGRFIQAAPCKYSKMFRKDVKMYLCQSMRAKGPNIRQAIIDRYPPIGGGKVPQIGTKKQPGPLYGVSSHVWAALALAITYEHFAKD